MEIYHFNPRPPRGGRPPNPPLTTLVIQFQSTPPARGATPRPRPPREPRDISIHAPREGGDPRSLSRASCSSVFQSTPPARGATRGRCGGRSAEGISIHAPREGGDQHGQRDTTLPQISIHAPREGGDQLLGPLRSLLCHFNPRPPRGGRLNVSPIIATLVLISIHAPREGGD